MQTIDLARLDLQNGHIALDLGCGRGRHTHAMYHHCGCRAVGLDMGFADVQRTRTGFLENPDLAPRVRAMSRYDLSVGDARALPFAPASFDRLICSEVLEHIHDYQRAIAEIWRIVKPGGKIGISVPRAWPEQICWWLSADYRNAPGGHVRIFNARALRRDFERAGFRYRGQHHTHGLHAPYWWLRCAVGTKNENHILVRLYHKLLVAEIIKNPFWLRLISRIADPLMGKSVVLYFEKPAA